MGRHADNPIPLEVLTGSNEAAIQDLAIKAMVAQRRAEAREITEEQVRACRRWLTHEAWLIDQGLTCEDGGPCLRAQVALVMAPHDTFQKRADLTAWLSREGRCCRYQQGAAP